VSRETLSELSRSAIHEELGVCARDLVGRPHQLPPDSPFLAILERENLLVEELRRRGRLVAKPESDWKWPKDSSQHRGVFAATRENLVEFRVKYGFGVSGDSCCNCGITVNLPGCQAGWFCPICGHFTSQSFSDCLPLIDEPTFGPDKVTILTACNEANWIQGECEAGRLRPSGENFHDYYDSLKPYLDRLKPGVYCDKTHGFKFDLEYSPQEEKTCSLGGMM